MTVRIPFRFIQGLDKVAQSQIERNFQELERGLARVGTAASLDAVVDGSLSADNPGKFLFTTVRAALVYLKGASSWATNRNVIIGIRHNASNNGGTAGAPTETADLDSTLMVGGATGVAIRLVALGARTVAWNLGTFSVFDSNWVFEGVNVYSSRTGSQTFGAASDLTFIGGGFIGGQSGSYDNGTIGASVIRAVDAVFNYATSQANSITLVACSIAYNTINSTWGAIGGLGFFFDDGCRWFLAGKTASILARTVAFTGSAMVDNSASSSFSFAGGTTQRVYITGGGEYAPGAQLNIDMNGEAKEAILISGLQGHNLTTNGGGHQSVSGSFSNAVDITGPANINISAQFLTVRSRGVTGTATLFGPGTSFTAIGWLDSTMVVSTYPTTPGAAYNIDVTSARNILIITGTTLHTASTNSSTTTQIITESGASPGGGAGGDLTGTYPNPSLAAIVAAGGPIGSATVAPVVTIDAKGRVTALGSAVISGVAPGGGAGGSLAGTYPNPTFAGRDASVDKILQDMLPSMLGGDPAGMAVIPVPAPGSAPTGTAAGSLAGTYPNPIFAGRDNSVDKINQDLLPSLLGGDAGSSGMTTIPATSGGGGPPTGAAAGSLAGTYPNPTFAGRDSSVDKINQDLLPSLLGGDPSGMAAVPPTVVSSPPIGSAAGSLAGTYPNPTFAGRDSSIDKVNQDLLPSMLGGDPSGMSVIPVVSGAGGPPSGAAAGSLAGTYPNPTLAGRDSSVDKINQDLLPSLLGGDPAGMAVIPAPQVDIQIFSASGTWTKPTGLRPNTQTRIVMVGGGGGGGAGRRGLSTASCGGGGGGGAAGYTDITVPTSSLSATEAVVVGAGGAGGLASTVDLTSGASGNNGISSSFAGVTTHPVIAGAAVGGVGGTAAAVAGGGSTISALYAGGAGGSGSAGAAAGVTPAGIVGIAGGGGGGGGGHSAVPAYTAGGSGAPGAGATGGVSTGGSFGAANAAGAGGNATSPAVFATSSYPYGGGGGGGGGAGSTTGGTGAAGGTYGGGGGGGGASTNGNNSGAGGAGANGIVVVTTYL